MKYLQTQNFSPIFILPFILTIAFICRAEAKETRITFPASTKGVVLAGTILEPNNLPILSVAVLLPVAGPTDRDGTLGPHRFFGSLAEALAKRGIATLRFDDRGVGLSSGNLLETDLNDRAADACQALKALRKHLRPSPLKTGFIGMSEGGAVGLLAASTCGPVAYTVMLSTPVREGKKVIEGQMARLLAQSELSNNQKLGVAIAARRLMKLASDVSPKRHRVEILKILTGPYGPLILPPYKFVPRSPEAQTDFVLSSWYRSQLNYNIGKSLTNANWRILILYGTLDQVANPKANADCAIKLNPKATVGIIPKLNHLMQEAKTGSPLEYARLPKSVSEKVVERVVDWIRKHEKTNVK